MIKVAPSILAFDRLNIGSDMECMIAAGCDMLHFDMMDGHFVPNISFGPDLLASIRKKTAMPVDAHLMVDNPSLYIEKLAEYGADIITVHQEIEEDVSGCISMIHSFGVKAGIALKPGTSVSKVENLLSRVDMVLVMTVEPGFGGQAFRQDMVEKVTTLRKMGYKGLIQVDGGVSMDNIFQLAHAGIDIAVMGTSLYRSSDRAAMISAIHRIDGQQT